MGNLLIHMRSRAAPGLLHATLALALLFGVAPVALAQTGTVSGIIADSKTRRPLADALVRVEGSEAFSRTNGRGQFQLNGLSGTTVRLRVSRIGYQPLTTDATVGAPPVRIELSELIVKLDEIVVTGTAGEQQQRTLGNVIGKVDVSNTVVIAPPAKLQDMLSVNVPGVRVIRASGAIGSGGITRIRGSGSLSLSNAPLVYVDGIRVANLDAVPSEAFFGAQESPSAINALNPEEIESIEILKGPSAATIYGTEASNGVIQIITKRGKQGRPTFEAKFDAGVNYLQNPVGRYDPNYYISALDGQVHSFDVLAFNEKYCAVAAHNCPVSPFTTGTPIAMGASLSGGNDQLSYFVSAGGSRDEGYVSYNWLNKFTSRANISYRAPGDKFKVDVSLGVVRSRLRGASGFQPITTSILWACNFPGCEPDYSNGGQDSSTTGWNGPGHGYQFYRPEDYNHVFAYDDLNKTTASVTIRHAPTPWFRQHLTIGPDYSNDKSSNLVERVPNGPFFDLSNGFKSGAELSGVFFTADYGASADWAVNKTLIATSSAGVQYYHKQFDRLHATGQTFAIPGPSDITGAADRQADESFQENKTFGVYAQEQVGWNNRVFLTAALRGDGNSAFGKNFKAVYYPKLSASWVASEEPAVAKLGWLSQLKVRAAWGRAGNQPDVFSAIQTYRGVVGHGGIGGVTP